MGTNFICAVPQIKSSVRAETRALIGGGDIFIYSRFPRQISSEISCF